MKLITMLLASVILLAACDDKEPQQVQNQPQNQVQTPQPGQPVIINQAPANNDGSAMNGMMGGLLLGTMLNNSGGNTHTVTKTRVIERPVYRPAPKYKPTRTVSRSRR